jgi:hypothetical protein
MVLLAGRSDTMEAWEAVNAAVAAARAEVAAAAPDAVIAAEGEAYVMRILATCLNDAFLGHLFTDSGLTRALPTRGGPNPDYRMAYAPLDRARRYRLEGRLNDSERVGIGLSASGRAVQRTSATMPRSITPRSRTMGDLPWTSRPTQRGLER